MTDYLIRPATLDDLETLVHHRVAMFTDMGVTIDGDALGRAFRAWLREAMAPGDYRAWLCEAGGHVVAGGGISLLRWPPGPRSVVGDRLAFVYNVYTEPAYRKRGLARSLMETIHAWCASHGIPAMALNAAGDARRLYESLGYVEAPNPMMFKLL
jgi:GNAT superfamily N-acetyltransferase